MPFYIEQVSAHNDLQGTISILRNNATGTKYYTIDVSPISTARQIWEYNYSEGFQTIAQANLFTRANTSQAKNIAKTWGLESNLKSTNVWTGVMNSSVQEIEIPYYLLFQQWPELGTPPSGTYQLDVEFRLWETSFTVNSSPPSGVAPFILPITFTVVMGGYAYVSFADNNGLPIDTIGLDETSDKIIDLKLLHKMNEPYDVTITSQNGGTLDLNTGTSIEKIPYNFYFIDMTTPINFQQTPIVTLLSNQPTVTATVPPVLREEEKVRIEIIFNSNANYTAGRYMDILTLEVKSHW